MNLRPVLRLIGHLMVLLAAAQVLPLGIALWYREPGSARAFLISAAASAAVGFALSRVRVTDERLYRREGVLIVVGSWVLASLLGAVPFLLSGDVPAVVDALFESASGFTTTGASTLVDIESASRSVLFWRSQTQWLGGLGIIVFFVALLSGVGPGARFLYQVEVPGPTAEVLHPRVRDTASSLLRIYLGLSAVQVVLLLAAGLGPYDAVTHTFSTLSTGGYSPRNASVAAFQSPAVELIVLVFMVVAGVNFSLLLSLRRHPRRVARDRELGVYLALIAGSVAVVTATLVALRSEPLVDALRAAAFQVVSIVTTTGFATVDFDSWPDGARALLLALMVCGGCAGSTAGGIKVMRVLIAFKTALREVRLSVSPRSVIPVTVRGAVVPDDVARAVSGFLILYGFALTTGALYLALRGFDLVTAFSAALACIGNIGPGLELVGPTLSFASFAALDKLVLVFLMWLGRLEILAIVAVLSRSYWRR